MYYWLVICRRFRESKLKKLRWILHSGPFALGLLCSFLGLPYYSSLGAVGGAVVCHIPPEPYVPVSWPGRFLFLVPGWMAVIISTAFTAMVIMEVRNTAQTGAKWKFKRWASRVSHRRGREGLEDEQRSVKRHSEEEVENEEEPPSLSLMQQILSSAELIRQKRRTKQQKKERREKKRRSKVEREVTFQAMLYLSALYLSWIILAVGHSRLSIGWSQSPYIYYIAQATLAPLQGFLNFIVVRSLHARTHIALLAGIFEILKIMLTHNIITPAREFACTRRRRLSILYCILLRPL